MKHSIYSHKCRMFVPLGILKWIDDLQTDLCVCTALYRCVLRQNLTRFSFLLLSFFNKLRAQLQSVNFERNLWIGAKLAWGLRYLRFRNFTFCVMNLQRRRDSIGQMVITTFVSRGSLQGTVDLHKKIIIGDFVYMPYSVISKVKNWM